MDERLLFVVSGISFFQQPSNEQDSRGGISGQKLGFGAVGRLGEFLVLGILAALKAI